VGGKPAFGKAVEERSVTETRVLGRILKKGGVVYQDYGSAHDAAEHYNYPPGHASIIPKANGRFAAIAGMDEEIFIPEHR
jgi:hypothetical protein